MKTILSTLIFLGSAFFHTTAFATWCDHDQWYSHKYDQCFDKYGKCWQYNDTDHNTCNSSNDKLKCDWDHKDQTCYPEMGGGHCQKGEWYSKKYDRCFKKKGHCGQYSHTDQRTCNTGSDHMRCDWNKHSRQCYPEHY